jgi:transcription antitermination factor NusG
MAYWAAARLESRREKVAQYFLEQSGFESTCRRSAGAPAARAPPGCRRYFPGYCFVHDEQMWRDISRLPGVIKPVMSGDEPAHVPDVIIAEIRSRERNGFVELPKKRLQPRDCV